MAAQSGSRASERIPEREPDRRMGDFSWFHNVLLAADGLAIRLWADEYGPQPDWLAMIAFEKAVAQNGITLALALQYLTPNIISRYILEPMTEDEAAARRVRVASMASPPSAAQVLAACRAAYDDVPLNQLALQLVRDELPKFRKAALLALGPLIRAKRCFIREAHVELPWEVEKVARVTCRESGCDDVEMQAVLNRMWPHIMVGVDDPDTSDVALCESTCEKHGVSRKLLKPFYYELMDAIATSSAHVSSVNGALTSTVCGCTPYVASALQT